MPEIKADKYSVLVIIYSTKYKFETGISEINERQKKAISYIRDKGNITNEEYQKIANTTKKTATRDLQDLVKREVFIKTGRTGKGVYYILNPVFKGDIIVSDSDLYEQNPDFYFNLPDCSSCLFFSRDSAVNFRSWQIN